MEHFFLMSQASRIRAPSIYQRHPNVFVDVCLWANFNFIWLLLLLIHYCIMTYARKNILHLLNSKVGCKETCTQVVS